MIQRAEELGQHREYLNKNGARVSSAGELRKSFESFVDTRRKGCSIIKVFVKPKTSCSVDTKQLSVSLVLIDTPFFLFLN